MRLDPFVAGLAIGGLCVALSIIIANYIMMRVVRKYEMRLRSKDTQIQLLRDSIDAMEKQKRRQNLFKQIEKPLK